MKYLWNSRWMWISDLDSRVSKKYENTKTTISQRGAKSSEIDKPKWTHKPKNQKKSGQTGNAKKLKRSFESIW